MAYIVKKLSGNNVLKFEQATGKVLKATDLPTVPLPILGSHLLIIFVS